jgi:hypothetical protein
MANFFPMLKGDRWYLLALLLFSFVAFLPWWREVYLAGMSIFGWLMAILMVFSPAVALLIFRVERKRAS